MVVTNDEFKGCGMQLRAERERLGYTRDQAAERADITSRYLAAIELGEKIPKADVLVKLIRGMGASANSVIYASQQQADDECERLARLFLQCTPKERKLIHEGHCSILRSNALFSRERPVFTLCRLLSSISRSVYCSVRGNLFVILYHRFHIRFSFASYLYHIFICGRLDVPCDRITPSAAAPQCCAVPGCGSTDAGSTPRRAAGPACRSPGAAM